MMMRFTIFISVFLFGLIFIPTGCRQKNDSATALIQGQVVPFENSFLTIIRVDTSSFTRIDSVKPDKDGAFSIRLKLQEAGIYQIRFKGQAVVPMVIHPGDEISLNIRNNSVEVEGGQEAGRFDIFRQQLNVCEEIADSLGTVLVLARDFENYEAIRAGADSAYYAMMHKAKEGGIVYIRDNSALLSQLLVINSKIQQAFLFDQTLDSSWFFYTDSALLTRFPLNPHVLANHQRIEQLRKMLSSERAARASMMAGKKAPELVLPGLNGKSVKLNPSKNNYTLVYFWAPTDGLSRKSNQELKNLYNQYKNLGFDVYAVSFDEYTERWAAAVNLDKLWWSNVNDTLLLNSPVAKSWVIQKLPVFVLVDREGEIVDRYTSVRNLGDRLASEFNR